MDNITIRPMTTKDIAIVVHWMIHVPLWQRYGVRAAAAKAQFEEGVQRHDILLVSDAGPEKRACGFTWCLPEGAFGLSPYLRLIGVQPGLNSSGMGSALLEATERAAAQSSKDMFLLVSDFNVDAQRFYRRHGYEQIGHIPGYVLPDVAELIFRKRL